MSDVNGPPRLVGRWGRPAALHRRPTTAELGSSGNNARAAPKSSIERKPSCFWVPRPGASTSPALELHFFRPSSGECLQTTFKGTWVVEVHNQTYKSRLPKNETSRWHKDFEGMGMGAEIVPKPFRISKNKKIEIYVYYIKYIYIYILYTKTW